MALPPAETAGSAPRRSQRSDWTIIKIVEGLRTALQFHQSITSFFSVLLEARQPLGGAGKRGRTFSTYRTPIALKSQGSSRRDPGSSPHVTSRV